MAVPDLDVSLLTYSAQIFTANHTLPQIRAIHKALQGQVDDKATRLRTQVGSSYRELLGTADTIVQMRADMDAAQATLAGMGARCGRAVVGTKVAAFAAFANHAQARSPLRLAARARLLDACVRTAACLLSRRAFQGSAAAGRTHATWGERLLLAAKVLVLSRLLVSSLGSTGSSGGGGDDDTNGWPAADAETDVAIRASIDTSTAALDGLRRRLRDHVEALERSIPRIDGASRGRASRAAAAAAGRDDLLRALCAHSLATTSSARDVLRQLLHVRSQAMALAFDEEEEEEYDDDGGSGGGGGDGGGGDGGDGKEEALRDAPDNDRRHRRAARKAQRVLRGLALYTHTLLDVQTLLPHRLPEALLGLKRRALLDDDALRQLESLRLDVDARWCGDDVLYFKPYIRHDDLDGPQAREMLAAWAARGAEVLLAGLRAALGTPTSDDAAPTPSGPFFDLGPLVDLRTRVLRLWIRDSNKVRGLDPADLLDQLRAVFHAHLRLVLAAKVAKLRLVGAEIAATLAAWQDGLTDRPARLWTESAPAADGHPRSLDTDLADGAVPFVRAVLARLHGRSDAVAKAAASFRTWCHVVDEAEAVLHQLARQRWDGSDGAADGDDADDDDDSDVVDDEDTIAQRQQLLSRQDPQRLFEALVAARAAAFRDLDAQIAGAWAQAVRALDEADESGSGSGSGSGNSNGNGSSAYAAAKRGQMAMYLVRVLRELRAHRRPLAPPVPPGAAAASSSPAGPGQTADVAQLGRGILPALHAATVRVVAARPLDTFTTRALARTAVSGQALWEETGPGEEDDSGSGSGSGSGSQPRALPATPSPGVFAFLRDLSAAMDSAGLDLWSPAAVARLKQQAAETLSARWTARLQTVVGGGGGGGGGKDAGGDKGAPALADDVARRALLLQWLFDVAWLRCSLGSTRGRSALGKKAAGELAALEDAVFAHTGLADGPPRQRMAAAAQTHWKKTSLLFGLLA